MVIDKSNWLFLPSLFLKEILSIIKWILQTLNSDHLPYS